MLISLNGPDKSGKSQQIRMLPYYNHKDLFHITAPLGNYSKRWPQLTGSEMFQWWFNTVGIEELIEMMIESLNARNKDRDKNKITVLDRGVRMFKAVCVATGVVRYDAPIYDVVATVDKSFQDGLDCDPDEEFEIFLSPDDHYIGSLNRYIDLTKVRGAEIFTADEEDFYIRYQSCLKKALEVYFSKTAYERIIVDGSICTIQNRIRRVEVYPFS